MSAFFNGLLVREDACVWESHPIYISPAPVPRAQGLWEDIDTPDCSHHQTICPHMQSCCITFSVILFVFGLIEFIIELDLVVLSTLSVSLLLIQIEILINSHLSFNWRNIYQICFSVTVQFTQCNLLIRVCPNRILYVTRNVWPIVLFMSNNLIWHGIDL